MSGNRAYLAAAEVTSRMVYLAKTAMHLHVVGLGSWHKTMRGNVV